MKKEEGKKCIANVIEHRYGGEIGQWKGEWVADVGCPGWRWEEEEEEAEVEEVEAEEEEEEASRYRCGGGWHAGRWREASHIGAGRGLRDWSKRSVAGADKKLHPKKVSPSPLCTPDRTSPPVRQPLAAHPARPAQASQTSDIHYSCRPTPLHGGTLKIVRKQIRPPLPRDRLPGPLS